jgi:hypothetical protein
VLLGLAQEDIDNALRPPGRAMVGA